MAQLRTVLVGFGRIAQANAFDQHMSQRMRLSTHAQALTEHPDFRWHAVVDSRPEALQAARDTWSVPWTAETISELPDRDTYEIAVIATPPSQRLEILQQLPALKGILVEKPLGVSEVYARAFVDECARRKIALQVNFLRRADMLTRELACGLLELTIGKVQAAFGVYCHGLLNNGIHVIDLARMLLGEAVSVQAVVGGIQDTDSPIDDDLNVSFNVVFESGVTLSVQPVKLEQYRENGLEIWGENGRLSYLNSGFTVFSNDTNENSLMSGERELNLSQMKDMDATLGEAFFEMYSNLSAAVVRNMPLYSSGGNALKTMEVAYAVRRSLENGGMPVAIRQAEVTV